MPNDKPQTTNTTEGSGLTEGGTSRKGGSSISQAALTKRHGPITGWGDRSEAAKNAGAECKLSSEVERRPSKSDVAGSNPAACSNELAGACAASSGSSGAASTHTPEGKSQTADRDALAAKYFPDSWKAAQEPGKSKSKKRNQLRNAAEDMEKKDQLRAQGASCANCSCLGTTQLRGRTETICELDSDFYGYSLTKPEHLCHRWRENKNDKAA